MSELVNYSVRNLGEIYIREAAANDLAALEWEGEYTHFRRLYREIYLLAKSGKAVLWVAEIRGTGIIGQLFVQLRSAHDILADGVHRAYLYSFRIRPSFQGLGIGSRILSTVEADLIGRGFQSACLNVNRDNFHAIKFYRDRGYRIIAPEPGRWSYRDDKGILIEVNEPAWRMEKRLG